jgi:hypothetical protein
MSWPGSTRRAPLEREPIKPMPTLVSAWGYGGRIGARLLVTLL